MAKEQLLLDVEDDVDVGVPGDGPGSERQLFPVVELELELRRQGQLAKDG